MMKKIGGNAKKQEQTLLIICGQIVASGVVNQTFESIGFKCFRPNVIHQYCS